MKMTRDFDHEKEVQKKKKMAFLRNEEYKETDQEDLSDSDEREMFEKNKEKEGEENIKANKNYQNSYFYYKKKKDNKNLINNNEYFKTDESRLNTESNLHHSKDSIVVDKDNLNCDNFKNKLNKQNSKEKNFKLRNNSDSDNSKEKKKLIEKSPKKARFNLACDDAKNEENKEDNNESKNKNISVNIKVRNNLASKKETAIIENNKSNTNKILIVNHHRKSIFNNNNNKEIALNKRNSINYKIEEALINEDNIDKNSIDPITACESSKSILNKKLNFIKNLPIEKMQELINTKKKKLEEQIQEGIKLRSEIKADQILEISLNDYSDLHRNDSDLMENNVHIKNLNRVIRVRNILKGKPRNEKQKQSYNNRGDENEEEISKIIRFKKLGPPSFLKTNFKKETNMKFRMLEGKFFGCQV